MQAGFGKVHTSEQILVRSARAKTGLLQQAFADLIKTLVATLRDWEQGRKEPDAAARAYLTVIARNPKAVSDALQPTP